QACPSSDCAQVAMPCDAVLSIQVADPGKTDQPFINQCVSVGRDTKNGLCALAAIDLAAVALPVRTLEVRVAVYPATEVAKNEHDEYVCPTDVAYNATTGFPVENWPTPALGGRTWYHPEI